MAQLRRTEMYVLVALAAGPLHGYGLVHRIEEDSEGQLRVLPGNLYTIIRRLETDGLIRESSTLPAADEDQRRRYFELTTKGRRVLIREARQLESLVERLRVIGLETVSEKPER